MPNNPRYFLFYLVLMINPVILTTCGHTFEEVVIKDWFKKQVSCPLCKKPSENSAIIKNFAIADAISNYN